MMNVKTLLSAAAVCGVLACGAAMAQEAKQPTDKQAQKEHTKEKAKGLRIGEPAPMFTATDTEGKSHTLADLKGKVVVLQWFNPECPAVVQHYAKGGNTFNDLYTNYSGKGVVFLAINSGAKGMQGYGADLNARMRKEWKMQYPVLLDESGVVGRSYFATNTPHMFIIDAEGRLAYQGAIDNGGFGKNGDKNYVAMALDEILKGTTVTTPETKAYGCSVKFAKN